MRSKITDIHHLLNQLKTHRQNQQAIVFTNGCFDILHAGHVRYLQAARREGDVLIIGLNSDSSVKSIKGELRPIVSQDQRAEVLAGLWCVDYIIIFDEPDPGRIIESIKPDVLVKGSDWEENQIIGSDTVVGAGGKVKRIPMVPELSTSQIIRKIQSLNNTNDP